MSKQKEQEVNLQQFINYLFCELEHMEFRLRLDLLTDKEDLSTDARGSLLYDSNTDRRWKLSINNLATSDLATMVDVPEQLIAKISQIKKAVNND